ncbi:hypothetical protein LCGC14_2890250 [marine sediment metagenome]|uniref:site-specific DNA-methyltransferase (adenine-specific) n=1 Tax=marine sediment metagenome TaxID=412755 RepID=A0A0F8XXF6_9ZZZZ
MMAKPFIKWAGGKTRLIKHYEQYFPTSYRRYIEPFVGGGAVFFHLAPKRALLGDYNDELIKTYTAVRDSVEGVIDLLSTYPNEETFFYAIREKSPDELSLIELAARFIYLNKNNFNGMYRLSKLSGNSNVPFGKHTEKYICDVGGLRLTSKALQRTTLKSGSYEKTLLAARSRDLIYLDPPYDSVGHTQYTLDGFDFGDQRRLAEEVSRLDALGCYIMLSNSDTSRIRALYTKFTIIPITTTRSISRKATDRGKRFQNY